MHISTLLLCVSEVNVKHSESSSFIYLVGLWADKALDTTLPDAGWMSAPNTTNYIGYHFYYYWHTDDPVLMSLDYLIHISKCNRNCYIIGWYVIHCSIHTALSLANIVSTGPINILSSIISFYINYTVVIHVYILISLQMSHPKFKYYSFIIGLCLIHFNICPEHWFISHPF